MSASTKPYGIVVGVDGVGRVQCRQLLEHAIKLAADAVETAAVDSDAREARQRGRPTNLYSSGIGSEYAGVDAVLSQRRGPS
jgi:hypothetical protein